MDVAYYFGKEKNGKIRYAWVTEILNDYTQNYYIFLPFIILLLEELGGHTR